MGYCKINFIGNLGRDPEMRYTPNGKQVTEFSVAVNQGTKNRETGEWSDDTDWFRVTVWGDRAEAAAEKLRKGNSVFVEGRFKTREYDAKDGSRRTSMEVTADSVIPMERKAREDGGEGPRERPAAAAASRPGSQGGGYQEDLDDLPF